MDELRPGPHAFHCSVERPVTPDGSSTVEKDVAVSPARIEVAPGARENVRLVLIEPKGTRLDVRIVFADSNGARDVDDVDVWLDPVSSPANSLFAELEKDVFTVAIPDVPPGDYDVRIGLTMHDVFDLLSPDPHRITVPDQPVHAVTLNVPAFEKD